MEKDYSVKLAAKFQNFAFPNSYSLAKRKDVRLAQEQGKSINVPWEQHLQWALEASNSGNPVMLKAMLLAGVHDRRVVFNLPKEILAEIVGSKQGMKTTDSDEPPFPFESVVFKPDFIDLERGDVQLVPKDNAVTVKTTSHATPSYPLGNVVMSPLEALNRKQAGLEGAAPSLKKFDHNRVFTDRDGMRAWIKDNKDLLKAPLCLLDDTDLTRGFQNKLIHWNRLAPAEKQAAVTTMKNELAAGREPRALIYDKFFFLFLQHQYLPFEKQSQEVVSLFNHVINTQGDEGRNLVREFFLGNGNGNESAFDNLMSSGSKEAFLTLSNAYTRFVLDTPDLFDLPEVGKILSLHVSNPYTLEDWNDLLRTPPITNIKDYFIFQQQQSEWLRISSARKELLLDDYIRADIEEQTLQHLIVILGYNHVGHLDIADFLASLSLNSGKVLDKDIQEFIADKGNSGWVSPYLDTLQTEETKKLESGNIELHDQDEVSFDLDDDDNYELEITETERRILGDDKNSTAHKSSAVQHPKKHLPLPYKSFSTLRELIHEHINALDKWPDDTIEVAKIYKNMDQLNLFLTVEWQLERRNHLLEVFGEEKDPLKKIEIAKVFFNHSQLRDAVLKEQITSVLIDSIKSLAVAKSLGIDGMDDGSVAYEEYLRPHIEWANKNIASVERYRLFVDLAEELQLQKTMSFELRDSFKLTKESLEESDVTLRKSEASLNLATKSPAHRKRFLNYYMNDLTPESRKEFAQWLMMKREIAKKYHAKNRSVQNGDSSDLNGERDKLAKEFNEEIHIDEDKDLDNLEEFIAVFDDSSNLEYYEIVAQQLYDSFWYSPLPARVIVVDQLLINVDNKVYDAKINAEQQQAYEEAFNYVVSKLIPSDIKYAEEAKTSLKCYNNSLPANERSLFLSALLGANDIAQNSSVSLSAGERLAIMLEMLGPATTKFGQAIGNYRNAPMDIRQPMVRLTKHASPPTRWEIWERYDDVVPKEYQSEVKRLGSARNSASYNETVRTEKTDGSRSIMVIQRPFVERRAEGGFITLRNFVQELEKMEKGLNANVAEAADSILQQAQRMSIKETDVCYRLDQVRQAQKYYNGLKIKVDGYEFTIKTADWLAYGVDREEQEGRIDRKEWCDQQEMMGVHFDELPLNSESDKSYQKAVAKALITVELMILISGNPIDHDRHSAQMRIDSSNNVIGNFDHGAMNLHIPTNKEKQMLAKVVANLLEHANKGEIKSDFFQSQIEELKAIAGKEMPDYIYEIERGFLAMMPFYELIGKDDLKEIAATVLKNKDLGVAQEVLDVKIKTPLGSLKVQNALKMFSGMLKSDIEIARETVAIPAEPKRFNYKTKQQSHPVFPGAKVSKSGGRNDEQLWITRIDEQVSTKQVTPKRPSKNSAKQDESFSSRG